jgi:hypothetical protein
MTDLIVSLIRTYVPWAVGAGIAYLVNAGFDIADDVSAAAAVAAVGLVSAAYYFAVRWLEAKFPWLGFLLGAPKQPTYPA